VYDSWRDGLRSALELIGKDHKVSWFLDKTLPDPEDEFDFTLVWDDSNTQASKISGRKGLCLTTDPHNVENLKNFDVIFAESTPVYEQCRAQGLRTIKAFGTDTDFFKPKKIKKEYKYFYPATFSPWKLQRNIAYLGKDLLCVGTVQPDGLEDLTKCTENGVRIVNDYLPVKKILEYYQKSSNVIIPAIHGSERTVLESMSFNIKPIVNPLNIKAYSYIKELDESGLTPRRFVVKNYSHYEYAKNLMKGMEVRE
jgi:hypothetical protein